MAKYTFQLRDICEQIAGRESFGEYDDVNNAINASVEELFKQSHDYFTNVANASDYNHIAENFMTRFFYDVAKMVLRHYYMREISAETVGLWKLWLNKKVINIADKYEIWYGKIKLDGHNLYEFEDIGYLKHYLGSDSMTHEGSGLDENDIDDNSFRTKTGTDNTTVDGTGNSNSHVKTDTYSQGNLSGDNDYVNAVEKTNNSNTSHSTDNNTVSERDDIRGANTVTYTTTKSKANGKEYTEEVHGISSDYSEIVRRFKESVHNIDVKVIEEFSDLFMQIY